MQLTARSLFLGSFVLVLGGLAGGFLLSRSQPGLLDFAAAKPVEPKVEPRAVAPRADLGTGEQATIRLFEESSPAVVYITSLEVRQQFFSRNVTQIPLGSGSGFVWDTAGHVVTNYHVIQNADGARVTLSDSTSWDAELVGSAPDKDLAVLRIKAPAAKLRPLPIGSSRDLRVGQSVLAIGNPFGLDQTLTTGVISALGRETESPAHIPIRDVIQTDAAINPGNSGGPLLDSAGRLIGVNTQIYSPSGASAGIGFAIPVDTVNWVVPELIAYGRIRRPSIGIDVAAPQVMQRWNLGEGTLITEIVPNSPAEKAGLRGLSLNRRGEMVLGDILLAIDGVKIRSAADIPLALDRKKGGDVITVTVRRGEREVEIPVTLATAR